MDMFMNISLAFSPLAPLAPLFSPLQLTWNPPCCDRIRPPRSQVALKLTPLFPSSGSYAPLPKILTPQGFPDPNIHSLERHCEPNPQSSLTSPSPWHLTLFHSSEIIFFITFTSTYQLSFSIISYWCVQSPQTPLSIPDTCCYQRVRKDSYSQDWPKLYWRPLWLAYQTFLFKITPCYVYNIVLCQSYNAC